VAKFAIGFGFLLIGLGLAGYLGTEVERRSATALIPAAFGAVLVLLGGLALKDKLRKHAMHAAATVGLIGFLMPAIMAGPKLPTLLSTGAVTRADGSDATRAVTLQLLMAFICLVFVALCVKSFVDARRARAARGEG
jgi:uncharacterized membrane-anchored protein